MVLLIASAGKPYYATGALPALIAVAAAQFVDVHQRHRRLVASTVAVNALLSAAMVLPVFPVSWVADSPASKVNPEPLEMIGWPEFVAQIADAYVNVDDGRGTTVIVTGNYGQAGAIDHYGNAYGLPAAYSGHNSYADFRQPPAAVGPVLVVGYLDPR